MKVFIHLSPATRIWNEPSPSPIEVPFKAVSKFVEPGLGTHLLEVS